MASLFKLPALVNARGQAVDNCHKRQRHGSLERAENELGNYAQTVLNQAVEPTLPMPTAPLHNQGVGTKRVLKLVHGPRGVTHELNINIKLFELLRNGDKVGQCGRR